MAAADWQDRELCRQPVEWFRAVYIPDVLVTVLATRLLRLVFELPGRALSVASEAKAFIDG